MFAHTTACALVGTFAERVTVEVDVEKGLPRLTIIGMSDAEARATRERVRCGLVSVGVGLPLSRVTVSLAPADMPKHGAGFDLSIAVAVCAAAGVLDPSAVADLAFHAELGLDGALHPARGGIAAAHCCARAGIGTLILADGARIPDGIGQLPVDVAQHASLESVIRWLKSGRPVATPITAPTGVSDGPDKAVTGGHRLADIRGNDLAVEAAVIAAAGGHNILLSGPPGCGKSMLCSALNELLPPLDYEASLEVATIHDAAGLAPPPGNAPPIRAPHHGISSVGLVGGGSGVPTVGEITLAHRGVLFLDELAEFRPSSIDSLRGPLEQGCVRLRRSRWQFVAPAQFQLIAAMNLCRCGRYGNKQGATCTCSDVERIRYWNRVSGALRSRFDINVSLTPPNDGVFAGAIPDAVDLTNRVRTARDIQKRRWNDLLNAQVQSIADERLRISEAARLLLGKLAFVRGLSGRSQLATSRVARTIADLQSSQEVLEEHMRMASRYAPVEVTDEAT